MKAVTKKIVNDNNEIKKCLINGVIEEETKQLDNKAKAQLETLNQILSQYSNDKIKNNIPMQIKANTKTVPRLINLSAAEIESIDQIIGLYCNKDKSNRT